MDREILSRTTTAPYGRRAVREPAARDIVVLEGAPAVARTQTGEWAGTSSLVVVVVASGAPAGAGADEEPDMPIDEDPSFEATEPGADYPVEPTAPAGRARHVELVEEIPTGHAIAHALEVTTIDVETERDGSPALPALAPLALEVPRRFARATGSPHPGPLEPAPELACSCHAAGHAALDGRTRHAPDGRDGRDEPDEPDERDGPGRHDARDGRDELDVENALQAWRSGVLHPRSDATAIRTADRELDELSVDRGTLRSLVLELAAPRDPEDPVRLVIRGRRGSGRHTTVAALAARIDRRIACIDARRLPDGPGRAIALRRELARAAGAGAIPVISGIEIHADDEPATVMRIEQLLRAHPGPLVVRTGEGARVPLDPCHIDVALAPLSEVDRRRAFAAALARHAVPASAELLAARHRIGPGTITDAAIEARRRLDHSDDEPTAIVDAVVRQQIAARVAGLAIRVTRLAGWDQVRLPELTLDRVHELIARARHGRTVLEDWGYDRFAARRGLTALFHGPSGTGKTLVSGLIARELGVELYRVDLDRLLSRPTCDTARQLDELFDAAEDGRFVLLLDDAAPWLAARPGPRTASERRDRAATDHLVQRLDAFEGVAIVTSHADDTLAPALRRRLSMRVRFGLPDEQLRVELWAAHVTPELPTAGALDFARLARVPLSGAAIRNCALRAAYLAAQDGFAMTQSHLERALAFEVGELGVLAGGPGDPAD